VSCGGIVSRLRSTSVFVQSVSGKHEYRAFHDPTGAASQDLPWILVVREVPEGGVSTHVHHGAYRTVYEAKQAAEQWQGPPPKAG
jgi:hypothetical protein